MLANVLKFIMQLCSCDEFWKKDGGNRSLLPVSAVLFPVYHASTIVSTIMIHDSVMLATVKGGGSKVQKVENTISR